ncbi:hypothetical protein C1I60_12750 [Paenibacillus terrae]|uniref:Uncharacterized protein n=1 Tax=Paenibacillus terrae TaxID=159743 RepID=A0A4U2PX54_9BACL|nr:hypothetical protein C1I60_12750 [Paenibacillus terrae]
MAKLFAKCSVPNKEQKNFENNFEDKISPILLDAHRLRMDRLLDRVEELAIGIMEALCKINVGQPEYCRSIRHS